MTVISPRIPYNLSKVQTCIFWFVALNPLGVTNKEIFDFLYENDPEGGPDRGVSRVNVVRSQMQPKLGACGLRIGPEVPRRHTLVNLRRLDNNHIWLPRIDR